MRYFIGHSQSLRSVSFSPNGRWLASAGWDGILLWDLMRGVAETPAFLDDAFVSVVAFSPEGNRVALGTHGGAIWVWDVQRRQAAQLEDQETVEMPMPVYYWGSGAEDADERGWWRGKRRITSLGWSNDGRYLVWSSYSGCMACEFHDSEPRTRPFHDQSLTTTVSLSPDGRTVASAGMGSEIILRDLCSWRVVARLRHEAFENCRDLAFSPDGRTLAAALAGGVQLWDVAEQKLRVQYQEHRDLVSGIAFSSDGRRLLTCSWDETARLYEMDPHTGRPSTLLGSYDWKLGRLFDVAFSADGMLAAACGHEEPYLVVWDVE